MPHKQKLGLAWWFVPLMATMSSWSALSIDIFLPALPVMQAHFDLTLSQTQSVITLFVLGMVFGDLIFGPLSDRLGRKVMILSGAGLFMVATGVCIIAEQSALVLAGRFVQGIGAAGPKIVVRALIRDVADGVRLAKLYSLIFLLFIFIPMVAPLIGQFLSQDGNWRLIFYSLLGFSAVVSILFAWLQSETLLEPQRSRISGKVVLQTLYKICCHQRILAYGMLAGVIFGIKLTYLSNIQNLFASQYDIHEQFPWYFAGLSSAIAIAFFLNSHLVGIYGSIRICGLACIGIVVTTALFALVTVASAGQPALSWFLTSFFALFFCFGLIWGNVSALAMNYMGEVAGLGSTFISATTAVVAYGLASLAGRIYTVDFTAFTICLWVYTCLGAGLFLMASRSQHRHSITRPLDTPKRSKIAK